VTVAVPDLTVEEFLDEAGRAHRSLRPGAPAPFRFGIDLGTATVVLAAVGADGRPAYFDQVAAGVVRDGVVVDFAGAVAAVCELRARAEAEVGAVITDAATAYPPGVGEADSRACRYVLEQAGIDCRMLVDEVSAAQRLLRLTDGVIADVGGGSTGVGVYRHGELVSLADRPGGGHQLNLILAGALSIDEGAAEELKRTDGGLHLSILAPGIERIADTILSMMGPQPCGVIHLVGGALMYPGAAAIVARYTGAPVKEHRFALLVTPFGIALS
jgi:ethanolamine utilization protein EutJ